MTEGDVIDFSERAFMRYAAAIDPRIDDLRRSDREFFAYVWGLEETAHEAVWRCKQYDRERLLVESD
ncbi:hypothetical protein FXW78_46910 [Rhodococcus opacus]|nr:hypothetical protein [Rhodococcus opacus]